MQNNFLAAVNNKYQTATAAVTEVTKQDIIGGINELMKVRASI
jgi:hypothetical protein